MAVPFCTPQPADVVDTITLNPAGNSATVVLLSSEHVEPDTETVTVYEPALNPDTCGPVCPLDHA